MAFATLRLTTDSNLIGFCTSNSPTFAQVIDGWRYFGFQPVEGESDADMGRRHAEVFYNVLRGAHIDHRRADLNAAGPGADGRQQRKRRG
jgi:hypothetical protein